MDEKDRIEHLFRFADACWRDYNERRSIEWKVNFSLWAGLGAFAGFMFQRPEQLSTQLRWVVLVVMGTVGLAYFFWKKEIQERNRVDVNNAQYYWTEADSVLGTTPPHSRKLLGKGWRPTHGSQVLITILFLLLALLSIFV